MAEGAVRPSPAFTSRGRFTPNAAHSRFESVCSPSGLSAKARVVWRVGERLHQRHPSCDLRFGQLDRRLLANRTRRQQQTGKDRQNSEAMKTKWMMHDFSSKNKG